jgi:structure-specific recognition protein 1
VEQVSKIFKNWYSKPFDVKEHSLRGWNWGKSDFSKDELTFNIQSRPGFEIPYSEIANTNLAGKNEVVVEFSLPTAGHENGTNGTNGTSKKVRGKKAASSLDQLVEMRFYIPGTAKRGGDEESGEENGDKAEEEEEQNAAQLFYDRIIDKAQIGEGSGDQIATFLEVLHLTPRGRFDIQLYENFVRLVGKTYDQKISHDRIKKFFLLPKPDEVHQLITIGLDPPLTQGQTKYPFLVMQFKLDEETILDLNLTDEQIASRYDGKLQQHYEAPMSTLVAQVFRGLYGKKIITPSRDFASVHGQSGLKCSIKANEGLLYCLSQAFLFVPKPASYISFEKVSVVTLSRVGGALAASRTFDVTLTLKSGEEHQFSNINKFASHSQILQFLTTV